MEYEKLKNIRNESPGFMKEIGLRITEISDGSVTAFLKVTEKHSNPIGSIHGGLLFTVADTVGGVTAATKGRMVTTANGGINYLRAGKVGDELTARGRVIKSGRLLCVVQVDIFNQNDEMLTTSILTYHFLSEEMDWDILLKNLQE